MLFRMNSPLTPFHIAVQVRDIAEARRFYGDTLGCAEGRSDTLWVDFNLYGHQFVCHLNPHLGAHGRLASHFNPVDGQGVPVPHFGVVLRPQQWSNWHCGYGTAASNSSSNPTLDSKGKQANNRRCFFWTPAATHWSSRRFKTSRLSSLPWMGPSRTQNNSSNSL